MAKYSMPRRGRWSALFATGKSSGSMECLSATSQAYARPERRPMRSRGSLKRRTNSRRLETLLSERCLIEDFEGSNWFDFSIGCILAVAETELGAVTWQRSGRRGKPNGRKQRSAGSVGASWVFLFLSLVKA